MIMNYRSYMYFLNGTVTLVLLPFDRPSHISFKLNMVCFQYVHDMSDVFATINEYNLSFQVQLYCNLHGVEV